MFAKRAKQLADGIPLEHKGQLKIIRNKERSDGASDRDFCLASGAEAQLTGDVYGPGKWVVTTAAWRATANMNSGRPEYYVKARRCPNRTGMNPSGAAFDVLLQVTGGNEPDVDVGDTLMMFLDSVGQPMAMPMCAPSSYSVMAQNPFWKGPPITEAVMTTADPLFEPTLIEPIQVYGQPPKPVFPSVFAAASGFPGVLQSTKIRVGFLVPNVYVGGAEWWKVYLARAMTEVDWVGCALLNREPPNQMMVNHLAALMPVYRPGPAAAHRVMRDADVVIVWGLTRIDELTEGWSGKVVVTTHGRDAAFTRLVVRDAVDPRFYHVAVSDYCLPVYQGLVPLDRVTVIENGIDPARCRSLKPRDEMRRLMGYSEDDVILLNVGRMAHDKGVDLAIRALPFLPERYKILVVGDGHEQERLQRLGKPFGDRVRFHHPVGDPGTFFGMADVSFLLSQNEGFSLVIAEAMYCGIPLVCTPVGIVPTLEKRYGRAWWQVELDGGPQETAAALQAAAENLQERRTFCHKAREIIEGDFLAEHMAARWMKYLNKIMEK